MSRIGRKPIPLPKGVSYVVKGNTVTVQGPKGKVTTHLSGWCGAGDQRRRPQHRPRE